MGMSVLAKEISQDLNLNLVQVGIVWGAGSLPSILTSLLGGAIGDRLGPRRVLVMTILLAGLLGAGRGLAVNYSSLVVIVILLGMFLPFVTMNGIKTASQWFPAQQLGLANGVFAMGMALGFLMGSLLSATLFSPLLGGWRHVLIGYGLLGACLSIPWFFTRSPSNGIQKRRAALSIPKAVLHVAGLKNIWLLGLSLFGVGGAIQGLLGYLPLYLRSIGWQPVLADGALSAFHTISLVCVMPIALWSDRLGSRKRLQLLAALMVALGTGMLSFASGGLIWAAVLLAGFVRDAFMAILQTMVIETEGIGSAYVGTAIGFVMALGGIGNFLAPPSGNSLAVLWPGAPFAFWSAVTILGMVCLSFAKSKAKQPEPVVLESTLE